MKHTLHLLTLIALLLCPLTTWAGYYIHQMTGDVKQLSDDRLVTPQRRASVSPSDRFVLQPGAMLAIADSESKRVYVTRTAGTQNVAQIISAARRQSSNATALALRQMRASATGKEKSVTVQGVVNRDDGSGASTVRRLYATLMRQLQNPDREKEISLILRRKIQGDTWHFIVVNKTGTVLYVNILALHAGQPPHLCLDTDKISPAVAVAPSGETNLTQFPFANDGSGGRYLLFASETPFNSQALQQLFDAGKQPDESTKPLPLLFYQLN